MSSDERAILAGLFLIITIASLFLIGDGYYWRNSFEVCVGIFISFLSTLTFGIMLGKESKE